MASSRPQALCHYCQLPVRGAASASDGDEPVYCCLGCRVADSVLSEESSGTNPLLFRLGWGIFFWLNVMVFSMATWSVELAPGTGGSAGDERSELLLGLLRAATVLFAVPVLLLLAPPVVAGAWDQWRRRTLGLESLLLLGTAAAVLYSALSLYRGRGHLFLDSACMVLVAVTLGKWLEATARRKSTHALASLRQLLPREARLVEGDQTRLIDLEQIAPGHRLRVLPGERVPADGVVLQGESTVDQQYFTGESRPVLRRRGQKVLAGSLVLDSPLEVEATAPARQSVLQQILEQVRQAFQQRQGHLALVDRVAGYFAPGVLVLALGTAWWHATHSGTEAALVAALSVLLVACPCSLALATPLAVCGALGRAARAGVLVRSGERLLLLGRAKTVALDKTGTLTQDQQVVRFSPAPGTDPQEALRLAALLARQTRHPAAQAVLEYAETRLSAASDALPGKLLGSRTLPGQGVLGTLQTESAQHELALGSPRWVASLAPQTNPESEATPTEAEPGAEEPSQVWLARDGRLLARFYLQEKLRPGAVESLKQLARDGLHLVLLTGDGQVRVPELLAEELPLEIHAGLSPQQKIEHVRRLQARWGTVAMVGDGVNDAPALAQADVSVSLAAGADVARDLADVCLLGQRLDRLGWVFALGRETRRLVRWNLLWALGYNVVALPVAAAGWLHPIGAALAMLGSSLLVTINSLRIQQEKTSEA